MNNNMSARIDQAIQVVLNVVSRYNANNSKSISNLYSESIKATANSFNVTEGSVRDKCERQMDLTSSDIKNLIQQYLKGNRNPLKNHFKKFVGHHTATIDMQANNQYL